MDSKIKFADFAEEWLKHKKKVLRTKTFSRYESMLPRINAAIGHLRLDRIQPQHLLSFYDNLSEGGIRHDTKYKCTLDLSKYMEENKLSNTFKSVKHENIDAQTIEKYIQYFKDAFILH